MDWKTSTDTYIWVFNVGRGLSVFIRTPKNYGILYDVGSSEDFSPMEFIKKHFLENLTKYESKIDGKADQHDLAQTVISHPHADHISEVKELKTFKMGLLTCPHDKTKEGIKDEKFDFEVIEDHENLRIYRSLFKERSLPLQTIKYEDANTTVLQAEYGIYYVRPPEVRKIHKDNDHQYGNGCSLVLYFKYGDQSILIPGDITPEALEQILDEKEGSEKRYSIFSRSASANDWHVKTGGQPSLRDQLKNHGLTILVAPHHGLESCYSQKLYDTIKDSKPSLVVISEKKHWGENDGKVDERYRGEKGAKGIDVNIEGTIEKQRYSVSTCNGYHYLIKFTSQKKVEVYGEKDPLKLLDKG